MMRKHQSPQKPKGGGGHAASNGGGSGAVDEEVEVDWMADKDASQCIICDKAFGRIQNRRHHCRNCGRLVCGDCSARKHILRGADTPQRVCNDCFEALNMKQHVKAQAKNRVDREYILLNTSSKVSDTLVRVYFLDGSFKTLYYTDNTRASDLVAKICFSVRLALFEVRLDMRDTTQFSLVPADESVMNILSRWQLNGKPFEFAKLVLPIYDLQSSLKGSASSVPKYSVGKLGSFVATVSTGAGAPSLALQDGQIGATVSFGGGISGFNLAGNSSGGGAGGNNITSRQTISGGGQQLSPGRRGQQSPPGRKGVKSGGGRFADNESDAGTVVSSAAGGGGGGRMSITSSFSFKGLGGGGNSSSNNGNNGSSTSGAHGPTTSSSSNAQSFQTLADVAINGGGNGSVLRDNTGDFDGDDGASVMGGGGGGGMVNNAAANANAAAVAELQYSLSRLAEDYSKMQREFDDLRKKHDILKSIQRNRSSVNSSTGAGAGVGTGGGAVGITGSMKRHARSLVRQSSSGPAPLLPGGAAGTSAGSGAAGGTAAFLQRYENAGFSDSEDDDVDMNSSRMSEVPDSFSKAEAPSTGGGFRATIAGGSPPFSGSSSKKGVTSVPFAGGNGSSASVSGASVGNGNGAAGAGRSAQPSPSFSISGESSNGLGSPFASPCPSPSPAKKKSGGGDAAIPGSSSGRGSGGAAAGGDGSEGSNGSNSNAQLVDMAADAFNNNAAYNSIFTRVHKDFSAAYLMKLRPRLQSKVFFTTIEEVENFILSYEHLVNSIIASPTGTSVGAGSGGGGGGAVSAVGMSPPKGSVKGDANVASSTDNSSSGGGPGGGSDHLVTLEPGYIITLYEIMNAMEGLYEFLFRYGEDWSKGIKDWLFRSLKRYMTLPVEHPEVLRVLLYCISRENKLFAAETIQVVQQVIVESFEDPSDSSSNVANGSGSGSGSGSGGSNGALPRTNSMRQGSGSASVGGGGGGSTMTLSAVLRSVNRMVDTLNYVVTDLIPLLPTEFNVVKMFTDRADIKIREDIATFYVNNRANISNKDLLTLLSFADRQEHALRKFGVDTAVITELSRDLLLQYCNTTQALMKQWLHRIAEADEKAEVRLLQGTVVMGSSNAAAFGNGSRDSISSSDAPQIAMTHSVVARGQITPWPEDLIKCVGEQLLLVHRELQDEARDSVSFLIIKMLPEFIKKSRQQLDHLAKNSETTPHCIERLCAYVNNHRRFVELLREREMSLCDALEGVSENTVIDGYVREFNNVIKSFKEEAAAGLTVLTKVISLDFKEALRSSLFQPNSQWLDGPIVIRSLQATLTDYSADLQKWLGSSIAGGAGGGVGSGTATAASKSSSSVTSASASTVGFGEDVNRVLAGVIKLIIHYYVEILLTSSGSIRLSHVIMQRIQEDVKVLQEVFREYLPTLYNGRMDALLYDLKPLHDVVTLCNMDMGRDCGTVMVAFVKNDLYTDFGSACIKVWAAVMSMKGESKDIQELIHSNIMQGGWNPPPVKPIITISYLDGGKKSSSSS